MLEMSAGTQMVVLFFILLALRLPVAFALGLSAIYAMWALGFGLDLAGDLDEESADEIGILGYVLAARDARGALGER